MLRMDTKRAFHTLQVVAFCTTGIFCAPAELVSAAELAKSSVSSDSIAAQQVPDEKSAESVELFDLTAALRRKTQGDKIGSELSRETAADSSPQTGLPLNADQLEKEFVSNTTTQADRSAAETIPAGDIVPVRGNLYSPGVELIPLDIPAEDIAPVEEVAATGSLPWDLPGFDDLPPLDLPEDPTLSQNAEIDLFDVPAARQEKVPFVFPGRQKCETPLGKPLASLSSDSLFEPLSRIKLSGTSTAPPLTDEPNSVLELPQDDSCAYAKEAYPAVYATEPQFAMCSPYRSPYPFRHNPLYYEDPNLERCGQSWSYLTNAKSVCLFASQIAAWPVHAVIQPRRSHVSALPSPPSYYRFGVGVYSPFLRKHANNVPKIKATRKIKK